MNTRILLLLTILCLLGARGLGVHWHVATPQSQAEQSQSLQTQTTAAHHLAHYGEDGDAAEVTEINLIGQNLNTIFMPALFVAAVFSLLLLLLPLAIKERLPRAPTRLDTSATRVFRLRPPSQAPPY
ncbi:MAG: hypothetical protein L0H29_09070 [Sinobacteraceae bacterium]|nr:hypothetical protein [Nevskiaceae bacterium]